MLSPYVLTKGNKHTEWTHGVGDGGASSSLSRWKGPQVNEGRVSESACSFFSYDTRSLTLNNVLVDEWKILGS